MNEKLLLIAPLFFGYYKEMINEAEKMGYKVTYICDAPSNSNISKAIGRINKKLISTSTKKYYHETILPIVSNDFFQKILIIGGMTFALFPEMVRMIKELQPDAKIVMYQWDSERNLPYSTFIHPYIDSLYTFDRFDCKSDSKYTFLPLFYINAYEQIGSENKTEFEYDCSYVGTAHPKKFEQISIMSKELKSLYPKQYIYQYMPSKLKYIYHKAKDKEYKHAKYKLFETKKLSTEEMMNIFRKSRCILDAPQAGQTGLTIRTIECLGARRKLITTNSDIKHYDFYDERNILVFDGNIDQNAPFFTNSFQNIPDSVYEKYSLRSWLKTMLDD